MGIFYSLLFNPSNNPEYRLCILGTANAGKTTLLYRILKKENVFTLPTIGFNFEILKFNQFSLMTYDIGGQDKLRALWPFYARNADIVWYLIDSSDRDSLKESVEIMTKTLSDEDVETACVAIILTKTDIEKGVTKEELLEVFKMDAIPQHQKVIMEISTITYNNVDVLLDWTAKRCRVAPIHYLSNWLSA